MRVTGGINAAAMAIICVCLPNKSLAGLQFGVLTPNQKVRPGDKPSSSTAATLRAARNEFEAFQIVLLSSGGATKGVAVKLAQPLSGPGGAAIPAKNVVLYAAGYYNAESPSNGEGAAGLWPDPLVPDVDTYFGEKRNAFPLEVPDGQSRVVWVDIQVPVDAKPGLYKGVLEVTVGGSSAGQVPVSLDVGSFALPSTASLASAFGMGWSAPCQAHFGNNNCGPDWNPDRGEAMHELYVRSALDHRFTISDAYYQPPYGGSQPSFEKYVLPLLDGKGPTRLPGAKLTAISVGGDLKTWISYAKSKGFFERTFYYPIDEPGDNASTWSQFISAAKTLHQIDPMARIIITAPIQEADAASATSQVDIFCPVINYLEDKADWSDYKGNQDSKYSAWLSGKSNRQLWAYQSCMSHGCGDCGTTTTDSYWNGWPNRVIDSSAVQDRAFPWIAFRHKLTGELYFDVTNQLSTAWSYNGQCKFGGHGDGTLFYPGKPSIIGGSKDIPVESIRMKLIREGMEDHEYLVLASAKDAAKTKAILDGLFPNTYSCAQPASKLEQARNQLFDLLNVPVPAGDGGRDPAAADDGGAPALSESGLPLGDGGGPATQAQHGNLSGGCGCWLGAPDEPLAPNFLGLVFIGLAMLVVGVVLWLAWAARSS